MRPSHLVLVLLIGLAGCNTASRLFDKEAIDRYVGSIGGATSLPGLKMVGLSIKDSGLTKSAKDELHGIYASKQRELESVND